MQHKLTARTVNPREADASYYDLEQTRGLTSTPKQRLACFELAIDCYRTHCRGQPNFDDAMSDVTV
jgi:hypothetical protein